MKRDDLFFDANVARLPATPSSPRPDRLAGADVRWLTLKLLESIGGNPRYATELDTRRILMAIEREADADETEPTAAGQLCRGLYLMAHGLHRTALTQFERALDGRIDGELDPVSRVALEAHAFGLLHIGSEQDARDEFERLMRRQLDRDPEPAPEVVGRVAELVSMLRLLDVVE